MTLVCDRIFRTFRPMRRTGREAFAAFRSSPNSQKLTQPSSERKTTAKITRQPFLVHLQHHAAPLSPSALLRFDFFVCGWSFRLPRSPPLMSVLFLSFSPPTAVVDCGVQPIKDRNHRVWQGRPQQHPQRFLILACFAPRAAAACLRLVVCGSSSRSQCCNASDTTDNNCCKEVKVEVQLFSHNSAQKDKEGHLGDYVFSSARLKK